MKANTMNPDQGYPYCLQYRLQEIHKGRSLEQTAICGKGLNFVIMLIKPVLLKKITQGEIL